ncbi:MAG: aspartate kinase [Clostridia bacterium]|nr:aspartate kinase [Clostridia bacterium]
MNIVVQKYGGTSVENKEKLEKICSRIIEYKEKGNGMVIVVSAQGKMTDNLIKMANDYVKDPDSKFLDVLLSTGEMQTAALLSMMLAEKGYKCSCLTSGMTGIITTSEYGNAKIKNVSPVVILNSLKEDNIVIVSGFQGMDRFGNITTLGRGGSDLSATAIASAIKADKCEIYTDVDGVLTADPKVIENAKLLENISYSEMLEAASNGAKVLHNRCVSFARKNDLDIAIKNSQTSSRGTLVTKATLNEKAEIKVITKKDNLTKISLISDMISETKELFSKVFTLSESLNIPIEMISFSEISLNIIVDTKHANILITQLHKLFLENS